jgi:hypothetical protein
MSAMRDYALWLEEHQLTDSAESKCQYIAEHDKPVVIKAMHYVETEARLTCDPVVIDMAEGVRQMNRAELADELGVPRHEFMLAANDEYRKRGGTDSGHIGAIAIAILALLDQTRS